jgi:hypothetical protein
LIDGGRYRSDATTNYLGTFTFDNLAAYTASQPSNYSRRIGDPAISYGNIQAGIYIQDDIRVRRNLTLTPGVRYELQRHVGDRLNIGPRFGATWAPFRSGQTTFRGSVGMFYDWLPTNTYDQTLRVDGVRQQELNVINPTFPEPGVGVVPPINRYELSDGFHLTRIVRVSAGADQQIRATRVAFTYSYQRGARLARGLNRNPLVDGVREDPSFANVIEVVSDAASRQHQLQVDAGVNPGALLPAFNGPRISWRRTTVFANYTLAWRDNNTDGPFSIPATGDLADEWGPSGADAGGGLPIGAPGLPPPPGSGGGGADVRSRLNLAFNNQIIRNVLIGINVNTSTAPPYTQLTGRDDNGDGVFNDRPAALGRNTLRATAQTTLNMSVGYVWAFGQTATLPPVTGVFGGGGAAQVRTFDQGNARYRLNLTVFIQNLTNAKNYRGYSGTMTSPFFGRPTSVSGMRKVDVALGLTF